MERPRIRDLGVKIGFFPTGPRNNIADVEGVTVGHCTLIKGKGKLVPGKGPVRTGVTVILPHGGNVFKEKVVAASYIINGFSKPVGLIQVEELGVIETPIALTNTLNIGLVADAIIEYSLIHNEDIGVTTGSVNPLVLECNDSFLNDIRGRHVKREHVFQAIENSCEDFVEGAVGAGTGMIAFEFKAGIGSSSRRLPGKYGGYTIGALVLSNFGRRENLVIKNAPVGLELKDYKRIFKPLDLGSIIVVLATDAPLTYRQLKRVAKRAAHGIARVGGCSLHGSGDVVVAFSTANRILHYPKKLEIEFKCIPDVKLSPLLHATVECVEEAILNSILRAETMDGRDNRVVHAIPVDILTSILTKYNVI
ncbi:MAG: P1 family peptidase [Thermoproteales archaeon]|nr:P1 family peptidase [Thermoproteales archaeon]